MVCASPPVTDATCGVVREGVERLQRREPRPTPPSVSCAGLERFGATAAAKPVKLAARSGVPKRAKARFGRDSRRRPPTRPAS